MSAGPFPPLAACLLWGLLCGVQTTLRRILSGWVLLTRSELLVILAVWLAANMVAGRGMVHPLLTSLAGPTYYARGALVTDAVTNHLHDGLAVMDRAAARQFFEGYGLPVPWQVWIRPLATWSLFFLPFLTTNVCLCGLFERVWVRHERLAFPLVALPVEGSAQVRSRWAGSVPTHNRPWDGVPPPAARLRCRTRLFSRHSLRAVLQRSFAADHRNTVDRPRPST